MYVSIVICRGNGEVNGRSHFFKAFLFTLMLGWALISS